MWWLAFPLLLAAFASVGDGVIWFLMNLALPVSIVTAAALVIMWPQCCLIRQAAGWLKTRSRTPGGSTKASGAVPHIAPDGQARVGGEAALAYPAGTDVGSGPPGRPFPFLPGPVPVDGSEPAALPSTGLDSASAAVQPPTPAALAGPPPWRRYVHG